jgi:hypothetical protein
MVAFPIRDMDLPTNFPSWSLTRKVIDLLVQVSDVSTETDVDGS